MKLIRYIKGERQGIGAHRLEREAMDDPFLADALEGYESSEEDHEAVMERLHRRVMRNAIHHRPRPIAVNIGVVACLLLICIVVGGYFVVFRVPPAESVTAVNLTLWDSLPQEVRVIAQASAEETESVRTALQQPAAVSPRTAPRLETIADKQPATCEIAEEINADQPDDLMLDCVGMAPSSAYAVAAKAESGNGNKERRIAQAQEKQAEEPLHQPAALQDIGRLAVSGVAVDVSAVGDKCQDERTGSQPVEGMPAYRKYIRQNLVHPTDSLCGKVSGTVTLRFNVLADGSPVNILVVGPLCPSCDREAIELVRRGPKWTPSPQPVSIEIRF